MKPIYLSDEAKANLKEIKSYIAKDSKVSAARFIKRIRATIQSLKRFPEAGSWLPEFDRDDLREVFIGSYRIIYQICDREVCVLKITHGAKRLPDSLGRN